MNTVQMIPVDLIDPHPHNPRRDLGDLTELAKSIEAQGIRQNLLLVPQTKGRFEAKRYTAVIGHRRLEAAKVACLTEVPCVIDEDLDDAGQIELMLLENIQRNDLSPVEEAEGYQQLLDLGVKVRAIAASTGRSEATVTARLRLVKLPDVVREKLHTHEATLEDAAQLDAFVAYPKELTKLAAALGTSNFRWMIEDSRRTVKMDEAKKHLKAELKKLGVPHHTSDGWAHNEFRQVVALRTVADLNKAVEFPIDSAWVDNYSGIAIIRPTTIEEQAESSGGNEEWEKRRAFDEAIEAEGQQAFELRDQFIRSLLARKRLAAKDTLLILNAATVLALTDPPQHYNLVRWLGSEGYASSEQARAMIAEQFPDAEPACWLLVALHLNTPRSTAWASAHSHPILVALYALLEQLGYPVSDAERARITPPAEEVE